MLILYIVGVLSKEQWRIKWENEHKMEISELWEIRLYKPKRLELCLGECVINERTREPSMSIFFLDLLACAYVV